MDPADRLAIRLAIRAIDASLAAQLALAKERRATNALQRFAQRQARLRNEDQGSPSIHGPWAPLYEARLIRPAAGAHMRWPRTYSVPRSVVELLVMPLTI
jgi:hypothetical protein